METGQGWDHPEPLLDEAGRTPHTPTQEPLEGTWPCDTRISEFRPPDRERAHLYCFQLPGLRPQQTNLFTSPGYYEANTFLSVWEVNMGSFHTIEAPGNQAAPKTRGRQVPKTTHIPSQKRGGWWCGRDSFRGVQEWGTQQPSHWSGPLVSSLPSLWLLAKPP